MNNNQRSFPKNLTSFPLLNSSPKNYSNCNFMQKLQSHRYFNTPYTLNSNIWKNFQQNNNITDNQISQGHFKGRDDFNQQIQERDCYILSNSDSGRNIHNSSQEGNQEMYMRKFQKQLENLYKKPGNAQQQEPIIQKSQKSQKQDINLWQFNFVQEMQQNAMKKQLQQIVNPYPIQTQAQNQYYFINSSSHQSAQSSSNYQVQPFHSTNKDNLSISISDFDNQIQRTSQQGSVRYNYQGLLQNYQERKQQTQLHIRFDNFYINIDSYQSQQQLSYLPTNQRQEQHDPLGNFAIRITNFNYHQYLRSSKLSNTPKKLFKKYPDQCILLSQSSSSSSSSSSQSSQSSSSNQQSEESCKFIQTIVIDNNRVKRDRPKNQIKSSIKQDQIKQKQKILNKLKLHSKKQIKQQKKINKLLKRKDTDYQNKKKLNKININSFPLKKSNDCVRKDQNNLQKRVILCEKTPVKVSSIGKFFEDLTKRRNKNNLTQVSQQSVQLQKKNIIKHKQTLNKEKVINYQQKAIKNNQQSPKKDIIQVRQKLTQQKATKCIQNKKQLKTIEPIIKQPIKNKIQLRVQREELIPRGKQKLHIQLKQLLKKMLYFKRPKVLQQKIISSIHSYNRSQLITCLLFNNKYFQNLGLKIPMAPKVSIIYESVQEYKRVFTANIKNQMYYQLRQRVKKVMQKQNKLKRNITNQDFCQSQIQISDIQNTQEEKKQCKKLFNLLIKEQEYLQRDNLYQLNSVIILDKMQKNFINLLNANINMYKSKHKLFLLVCRTRSRQTSGSRMDIELCSILCQVKEIQMPNQRNRRTLNMQSQQFQSGIVISLLTGVDISTVFYNKDIISSLNNVSNVNSGNNNLLPFQGVLYDLDRLATQIRQYQAVINLKFNRLSSIILDPRKIHDSEHKPKHILNQQIIQHSTPYKIQLNKLYETIIKPTFNKFQYESIKQITEQSAGIQLLQGPPGTGKTSTLLGILSCQYIRLSYYNKILEQVDQCKRKIRQIKYKNNNGQNISLQKDNEIQDFSESDYTNSVQENTMSKTQAKKSQKLNYLKILICTPSNSAIDLITNKIISQGLFKNSTQQELEWTGLEVYRKMFKNVNNTINIYQETKNEELQSRNLQKKKQNTNINMKNRRYPKILRIGVMQQQTQKDQKNQNKAETKPQFHKNIDISPYSYQQIYQKYLHQKNHNLYYLINTLFAQEMKNYQKYINNQQIQSKLTSLNGQIHQIKSVICALVRNFNQHLTIGNVDLFKLDQQNNSVVNCLNNVLHIKSTILQAFTSILSSPSNTYSHHKKSAPSNHQNLKQVMKQIQISLIYSSQIILTTLTTSYSDKIISCNPTFISLIVDEAAQSTQPNLLIPLQYGMNKVILIGDQCQLPATISNPELIKGMYSRSLFQRFWQSYSQNIQKYLQDIQENTYLHKKQKQKQHFHTLNIQYRMNPLICQFPSDNFYNNRLVSSQSVINRSRKAQQFYLKVKQVCFIDCVKSKQEKVFNSFVNKIEAQCVVSIVIKIMKNSSQRQFVSTPESISIGIITPYSEQQNYIRRLLKQKKTSLPVQNIKNINITVSTVDSYQGQQRDIILISTVRANHRGNVGFLTDQRRINVALTRAKYALIVVGHSETLNSNIIWSKYIKWVQKMGTYQRYQGLQTNNAKQIHQLLIQLFEGHTLEKANSKKLKQQYEKNLANFPLINKLNTQEQESLGMKIVLKPKSNKTQQQKSKNQQKQKQVIDIGDIIQIDRKVKKNIFDRIDY